MGKEWIFVGKENLIMLSIQTAVGCGRRSHRVPKPFCIPHIVRDLEFDTDLLSLHGSGERKVPEQC